MRAKSEISKESRLLLPCDSLILEVLLDIREILIGKNTDKRPMMHKKDLLKIVKEVRK